MKKKKAKKARTLIIQRIVLFILLAFFLRVVVLLIAPDPSKPTIDTSMLVNLIGTIDRYLHPVDRNKHQGGVPTDIWEKSLARKVRDEMVFSRLSEMTLREELKPPLPRVSLFPPGKVDEYEQKMILENSRFYREMKKLVHGEEKEKHYFDFPRPKASEVKGGTIPLPEDIAARRIITSLQEAAQEEGEVKQSVGAADLGIKGPAANRKINYIPPTSDEKISVNGDRLLKFLIYPDGTVGKIIFLDRGDDQAAIVILNRLKKYRFNPLPADVPQVEMWGTIPVKSLLK